ncbi:MAG: DUF3365 domain-containing protein [Thermodesulfobacteriota bacterium]
MSIRVRFMIIIGVMSLLVMLFFAYISYSFSVKNAMDEARVRGSLVFNMFDVTRANFIKNQRPLVTELVEEDRFYPQIMSGFVVTRSIAEIFKKRFPDYSYRQASLDPLYPPNKADEQERQLIAEFVKDKAKSKEGVMDKGSEAFYFFAKPIVVKEKCLRCHSSPDEAPKDQVEIYGTESGYEWRLNEVVSATIVYIPIKTALAAAKKNAINLFLFGSLAVVVLMGTVWIFLSRGVVDPLSRLEEKTAQISLGKELGQEVGISSKDEIGSLARAIDRLRISTAKLLERCSKK